MEIVKSTRGFNLVSLNGFLYSKIRQYKNGNYAYKCVENNCAASGMLLSDKIDSNVPWIYILNLYKLLWGDTKSI